MKLRRALVVAVLAGCGGGGPGSLFGDGGIPDAPDPYQVVAEVPVTINRNVDLLFVIDDSASMLDKQTNLANNFPNFINVLNTFPGGLPDVHIGVVSTDMGTQGSEGTAGPPIGSLGSGGCAQGGKAGNLQTNGASVLGTFISDIKQTDGSRIRNYTGDLASVFSQMARLGGSGCGFEQPLAAMKAALDNNPANAGFLRPEAALAVVFLTDEDDCSFRNASMLGPDSGALGPLASFRCTRFGVTCGTGGITPDAMNQVGTKDNCQGSVGSPYMTDVQPFTNFLLSLKGGDTRKLAVASVMGTTTPFAVELRSPPGGGTAVPALAHSCTYSGAQGPEASDPPVRLAEFLAGFPQASTTTSICQQDLSGGLVQIGELLNRRLGSSCVNTAAIDLDPGQAGGQYDCIVEDLRGTSAILIPACGATPQAPCWRFETDALNCPGPDQQKLVIQRNEAPPPETVVRMRCRVP